MGVQKLSAKDFGVLHNPGVASVQLVWARNAPDARVTVTRVTMEPGSAQALHAHADAEQTWIVETGSATMLLGDDQSLALNAGDVVRTPPGHVHGLACDGDGRFVYLTITSPPQDFTTSYATTRP